MDITLAKKNLRETVKKRIASLSAEEKRQASERILKAVTLLDAYKKATSVMLYAATKNEVDTLPLIENILERGLSLWLPWCDVETTSIVPVEIRDIKQDLVPGTYGILSPREPKVKAIPSGFHPSIIFVPGVAFDKKGNRLGRGLGYYDKFLTSLAPEVLKIGLAFECQMEKEIPAEAFDYKLDRVISG